MEKKAFPVLSTCSLLQLQIQDYFLLLLSKQFQISNKPLSCPNLTEI